MSASPHIQSAAKALLGLKTPAPRKEAGVLYSPPARCVLSDEQEAFLALDAPRLVLTALAGCGKSRVLAEYASRHSHRKWAYLAFNKRMAQDASAMMPHVSCKTIHSLAFSAFGLPYQDKLDGIWASSALLARAWPRPAQAPAALSRLLLGTVARFVASPDIALSPSHIPHGLWKEAATDHQGQSSTVVEAAYRLWEGMVDTGCALPMTLDGLVKLMQLAQHNPFPSRSAAVLIDEAQDLTPCIRHWLDQLPHPTVRAGDPFQSIYGWRMHGMQQPWTVPGETAGWLCGSWRFGPEVGTLVNPLLGALGSPHGLVGLAAPTCIDTRPSGEGVLLARTRLGLVSAAVRAITQGAKLDLTAAPWLVAALEGKSMEDISPDWEDASTAWTKDALLYAADLRKHQSVGPGSLRVMTAHSSKGATFGRVQLAEDFSWPPEGTDDSATENIRLLYVALTRAQHHLVLPAPLLAALRSDPRTPAKSSAVVLGDDGF